MSKVTVRVPTPLRSFTGGAGEVLIEGSSVGDILRQLVTRHDGLSRHLFDADGELRQFINIYLDDRNVRALDGLDSVVENGDVVNIVPAVAGGTR